MIVSLHIPKTAGTSLREELIRIYGNKLKLDYRIPEADPAFYQLKKKYDDWIAKHSSFKNTEIIHGHFHLDRYFEHKATEKVITFLRDPVDRVISHYYFWKNATAPTRSVYRCHPVIKLIHEDKIDVVEFAKTTAMQTFYRRFLSGHGVTELTFVGITERYADSINYINMLCDTDIQFLTKNTCKASPFEICKADRQLLKEYNEDNYFYYNKALELFEQRMREL